MWNAILLPLEVIHLLLPSFKVKATRDWTTDQTEILLDWFEKQINHQLSICLFCWSIIIIDQQKVFTVMVPIKKWNKNEMFQMNKSIEN